MEGTQPRSGLQLLKSLKTARCRITQARALHLAHVQGCHQMSIVVALVISSDQSQPSIPKYEHLRL